MNLLAERNREYKELAEGYQEMFSEYQAFQREHLETCVAFEQKVHLLELEIGGLESEVDGIGTTRPSVSAMGQELESLRKQLAEANLLSEYYQEQCDAISESYGGLDPKEVQKIKSLNDSLQKKVDHYRKRCLQQQHQLTYYNNLLGENRS